MALDGIDCIGGSTIVLIKEQTVVESGRQVAGCGPWDPGGVNFYKVTYGEEVTLRASAAGYQTQEQTVVVREITPTDNAIVFLSMQRIQ